MDRKKVLFVCMGNICRSPTAEGIFNNIVNKNNAANRYVIDSAGTHGYHVGSKPDVRSMATALTNGIDLSCQKSRQLTETDFDIFDNIIAMDHNNMSYMRAMCPSTYYHKLNLLLEFATNCELEEVPDPYHFSDDGFNDVFELIFNGCQGLYHKLEI